MKIFILEERERLSRMISYSLDVQKEQVRTFHTLDEMAQAASADRPDLILLYEEQDSSWAVATMKQIKESEEMSGIPVILLAEKASENEIVSGLDGGAELFMTAPFGAAELHAYIHAVMRRIQSRTGEEEGLRCGRIRIFPGQYQVFVDEKEIDLLPSEFMIMKILMENEGSVMTNHQIAREMKNAGKEVRPSTVKVRVNALKSKIPDGKRMFHTIRGVGYKFEEEDTVK